MCYLGGVGWSKRRSKCFALKPDAVFFISKKTFSSRRTKENDDEEEEENTKNFLQQNKKTSFSFFLVLQVGVVAVVVVVGWLRVGHLGGHDVDDDHHDEGIEDETRP